MALPEHAQDDLDAKLAAVAWHLPSVRQYAQSLGIEVTINKYRERATVTIGDPLKGVDAQHKVHKQSGNVVGVEMPASSFTNRMVNAIKENFSPDGFDLFIYEDKTISVGFVYGGQSAGRET